MYIHKESACYLQWDNAKNLKNIEKHGVAFDEAATILFDSNALEYYDQEHSDREDRFWIIGRSYDGRILLMIYTLRSQNHGKEIYYRIISARIANEKERRPYETQEKKL